MQVADRALSFKQSLSLLHCASSLSVWHSLLPTVVSASTGKNSFALLRHAHAGSIGCPIDKATAMAESLPMAPLWALVADGRCHWIGPLALVDCPYSAFVRLDRSGHHICLSRVS